jgi:hypothetical protein
VERSIADGDGLSSSQQNTCHQEIAKTTVLDKMREKRMAEHLLTPNRKVVGEEGRRMSPRETRSASAKKIKRHDDEEISHLLGFVIDDNDVGPENIVTVNEENANTEVKLTKKQQALHEGRERARKWAAANFGQPKISIQQMEDEIAKLKKLVTDPRQSLADQEVFTDESLKQELEAARWSMAGFQEQERMYLNQIRSIKEMLQQKQVELEEARLSNDEVMKEAAAPEEKLNQLGSENSELRLLVQTLMANEVDLRQRLVDQETSSDELLRRAKREFEEYCHGAVEESVKVLALRKENADLKSSFDSRESSLLHHLQVQDEIRRHLHNRVIQLTGNMIVFVRVRPAIESEKHANTDTPFMFPSIHDRDISSTASDEDLTKHALVVTEPFKDRGGLTPRQKKYKFCFDHVFTPNSSQDNVWTGVEPLVQSAIDGFNVCFLAYGQTGMYFSLESPDLLWAVTRQFSFSFLCCV